VGGAEVEDLVIPPDLRAGREDEHVVRPDVLLDHLADAAPLGGPIPMRSIGALYNPQSASAFFTRQVFPNDFDLLIFVRQATQSTLLPFSY